MSTDREKEREAELEGAMYTNCLLLGLDPVVLGSPAGAASPRVGLFRHSNPRLGEQLLYFLLSSLRGPAQSAKDFDKVWPIFDSAQSREFRKIVQCIISELEQQGALPRSNSRVSSLATCCGPRFVELLWQLSVHALREVHRRTFAADVASNPLPAALTDVSYLHAAALLPVTKARIALERRKFLKNANIAVQRQTTWSNLAHEMTAEFRSLCAEEAYLQQELEKLQDMRNKAKLEGELWDERISSSSGQNSHLVSKATRLWESILARKGQHEVLASGPIEDLIAHREHRYRISGSQLLAAMDTSSSIPHSELLSARAGETSQILDKQEQISLFQGKEEALPRLDDRNGRVQQTVDVAEILRRWTHALQRIHKQSLHLAKANDGEGPELLCSASDSETSSHADSLTATLAEHRQHLVSIQGLINQLKEAIPAMQQSITKLSEEVNSVPSNLMDQTNSRQLSVQNTVLGRPEESSGEVSEMTSKLCSTQIGKAGSSPALKLPPLFSLTPSSSGKGAQTQRRNALAHQPRQEIMPEEKALTHPSAKDQANGSMHENDGYFAHDIRRSVREAALSKPLSNMESPQDKSSDDGSEHFFIPLSTGAARKDVGAVANRRKQKIGPSSSQSKLPKSTSDLYFNPDSPMHTTPAVSSKLNGHDDPSSAANFFYPVSGQSFMTDDALDQVFSPPLLLESSLFPDMYEDLLAPLSETDAALMEH
ncbi:AUGMIN subunit 6 isoform X2 [Aegilops tauschii subsp. strangulata]|uniref:HAUS augmin-like complex subunit 6 N-terminal domain-containing protein n=1 Tax=Aegilops tauschii subsp. strangulata TaxID=200361 RepID=A0A453K414_AEGTS|nr:AUGMIN subunit 6 isoform X2 [Aegilops tauschii subsp. strangulata]